MNDKFIDILEEQIIFEFTGRLNVLLKENRQLLGVVLFNKGKIIHAKYHALNSFRALGKILLDDNTQESLSFIIEPEIIENVIPNIDLSTEKVLDSLHKLSSHAKDSENLRPPNNLRLTINADFIWRGANISPKEFDLLCVISDYNEVERIYQNCPYMEFETTQILVSLRKENAIKIIK